MENTTNRQYELDVLRIIAMIGVMFFHYTYRGFEGGYYSSISFPTLGEIFKYGYLGVYLFLIISGYVMAASTPGKYFKDFAISRIVRLFPLYWISVTLISVIILLIGADKFHITPLQYLANLTMFNDIMGISYVDGAHWFVAEAILRFNIIIAVILLFRLIKFQEYLAGIWLLVAYILNFLDLPVIGFFLIPEYAPFFVAGIIFLSAKTKGWNTYRYIIIMLSLFLSVYVLIEDIINTQQHALSAYVISTIVVLFYLAFYFITIRKKSINLPESFIFYGAATYPLYLIHQNIGYMLFNLLADSINKYLLLLLTSIAMISASLVITKYLEPYIYKKSRKALEVFISFTGIKLRKKYT